MARTKKPTRKTTSKPKKRADSKTKKSTRTKRPTRKIPTITGKPGKKIYSRITGSPSWYRVTVDCNVNNAFIIKSNTHALAATVEVKNNGKCPLNVTLSNYTITGGPVYNRSTSNVKTNGNYKKTNQRDIQHIAIHCQRCSRNTHAVCTFDYRVTWHSS